MKHFTRRKLLFNSLLLALLKCTLCDNIIQISTHDLKIKLNEKDSFHLNVSNFTNANKSITLNFKVQHSDIVQLTYQSIEIRENWNISVDVNAVGPGHSYVSVYNSTDADLDISNLFLRVIVYKIAALDTISSIIGWLYFLAWSVSFYPQIYINYKRKSVVGLNFDFLILNIVGFTLYSIFNLGLYYIPEIKDEYFHRNPKGLNPVQINDIVFSLHATLATILTIIQCFIYERNDQKVSITARLILALFGCFLFISIILAGTNVIHWLDFLYYCSYVKLTITLIKYMPQAYMNYNRQSTVGWSIGNIFLDFTGGILSMLQMIINAVNYDDWVSIFGDPTKFGLGLFSVFFDIFFIVQHYILYRHTTYEEN